MAQKSDPKNSRTSSDTATSDSGQGDAGQPLLTPTTPTTEESDDDSARNNGKLNPSF